MANSAVDTALAAEIQAYRSTPALHVPRVAIAAAEGTTLSFTLFPLYAVFLSSLLACLALSSSGMPCRALAVSRFCLIATSGLFTVMCFSDCYFSATFSATFSLRHSPSSLVRLDSACCSDLPTMLLTASASVLTCSFLALHCVLSLHCYSLLLTLLTLLGLMAASPVFLCLASHVVRRRERQHGAGCCRWQCGVQYHPA